MNYYKLGCIWDAKTKNWKSFYEVLKKHKIVIMWDSLIIGDVIAIAEGYDVKAIGIIKTNVNCLDGSKYKKEFNGCIPPQEFKNIYYYEVEWIDIFPIINYKNQKGWSNIPQNNRIIITQINDKITEYTKNKMENKIKDLLQENHNLILTGAPGTGKTYLAKQIAMQMILEEVKEETSFSSDEQSKWKEQYDFVQFHPSYDYTDFVEGLRPKKNSEQTEIGFELKNGVFKDFCKKAKDNPTKKFIFVIDEINRGEISKIFGELFFSIDPGYRGIKGKVKTQYTNIQTEETRFAKELDEGDFYVPENVYIIGTMNDIDRSVESFDFAMRRRFTWVEITAEESAENMKLSEESKERMKNLNAEISKIEGLNSSYHIGGAYFLKKDDTPETDFDNLWKLRLKPLLFEYLRGMPDADESLKKLENAYKPSKTSDADNGQ